MRRAILYALLAAAAALCYSAGPPQQQQPPPKQDTPPKQEPPKSDPKKSDTVPESISPVIPVGQAVEPAKPGSVTPATDPAAMAKPAGETLPKAAEPDDSYVIGAEDDLIVRVWGNAELSGPYKVDPKGKISMPLIRDVQAAGLTKEQLAASITGRLKENTLIDPQVTVSVQQVNSKWYYINGHVLKPGQYRLAVPTTVLEGLVNAGGFQEWADEKHITILRAGKIYKFNYKEVSQGKHLEQNILLEPGDQIFVK